MVLPGPRRRRRRRRLHRRVLGARGVRSIRWP